MTGTKISISLEGQTGPKYRQLHGALVQAIRTGQLRPGTKLPPVRELAWDLGITPGTVARAYQLTTEAGLLSATIGSGTFVRGTQRAKADIPPNMVTVMRGDAVNMRSGHTAEIGQTAVLKDLFREVCDDPDLFLGQYVPDTSLRGCREAGADWVNAQGIIGAAEDVIITYGAHNAALAALSGILHGKSPGVATNALTYPGFLQSAHLCRAELFAVDEDEEGLNPETLEKLCQHNNIQALLICTEIHNPTARRTTPARREALAEIARRYDIQVIDDDVYGTLVERIGPTLQSLCPERVWVTTSISKCFAAGMRIGFLITPPGLGHVGLRTMQALSFSVSYPLTRVAEMALRRGIVERFRNAIYAENVQRMDILREYLGQYNFTTVPGVNFAWMAAPKGWQANALRQACEAQNVLIASADSFVAADTKPPNAIRISVGGPADQAELRQTLQKIQGVFASPSIEIFA